ncbi:iron-containing alcohol dehydrogenase [Schumannella soli]|nr:iron-containing alcohol dehydrogenase [Schumannella soli]
MSASPTGTLRLPGRIHFGGGVRAQLPELVQQHGRRALVVVDAALATTTIVTDLIDAVRERGITVQIETGVQPELPVPSLDELGVSARRFGPDVVVGIGGGSALDATKIIALLVAHGGPLANFYGENAVPGPVAPIIALPTTAGTGSEATPVAVVSDPDRELKVGISSPHLVPVAALVDPELTYGAPASVTAHSGIDALVHAVESYTATPFDLDWSSAQPVFTGRNLFSDLLALEGVRRLGRWLPAAVHSPSDRDARREVAYGSLLGGMTFGSTGTHLSHALQYPVGGLTHTPHGLGTGLLLPYVLEALRGDDEVDARIADIGRALGSTADDVDSLADDAVRITADLGARIGLPPSLAEIGVAADQLPRIAELGLASGRLVAISPRPATAELLLGILQRAHVGALRTRSTS